MDPIFSTILNFFTIDGKLLVSACIQSVHKIFRERE